MKKLFALIIAVIILVSIMPFSVCAESAPEIKSGSAVVIDATSGQVLYDFNMNEQKYPASITKIITIYLGASLDQGKMLTATESAIDAVPRDTSNIALDYGEEISVKDALHAAQLMSANDASNVIAEGVSGSVENFVGLMNQTAQKFGAVNTHFSNANGLFDKENYTTAYDMALITMNAMKNETFFKVFSTVQYSVGATNKKTEKRNFVAQHRMVHWAQYEHLGVKAGKSGYTGESGHTLVTYGERDGKKIIVVVMDSPDFRTVYDDTEKLLEYGYTNFEYNTVKMMSVPKKVDGLTTYIPKSDVTFLLDKNLNTDVIEYEYTNEGIHLKAPDGKTLATMQVEVNVKEPFRKKLFRTLSWTLGIFLVVSIIWFVFLMVVENKKKTERKKQRDYIKKNMK